MSDHTAHEFDSDADRTPIRPGQMTSNGHWVFGSIYAVLTLIGFSFGVWAGAPPKTKPVESADVKQKEAVEKPVEKPAAKTPVVPPPVVMPPVEQKPMEPDPVKPDPPKVDPPKVDPPKPPVKDPPKTDPPTPPAKAVAFKEIEPIFRTYCNNCHGASTGKPKGGIDLRTIVAIKKGGNNGEILTVGEPMKSKLYTSMLPGAAEQMPPDGKPAPSQKEIMLIHDWIASGAKPRRTVRRRTGWN